MRARTLGVVAVVLGALLLGLPAHAVTPLTFADPAGDALDAQASMDIVEVAWSVGKTNTGKPQFVISMKLAEPPRLLLAAYGIEGRLGDDPGCDEFEVDFRPGRALERLGNSPFELWVDDCQPEDAVNGNITLATAKGEVKGSTITWFIPFDSVKKKALAVGKFHAISAFTGTVDPVFGLEGNASIEGNELLPTDSAATEKLFSFS